MGSALLTLQDGGRPALQLRGPAHDGIEPLAAELLRVAIGLEAPKDALSLLGSRILSMVASPLQQVIVRIVTGQNRQLRDRAGQPEAA